MATVLEVKRLAESSKLPSRGSLLAAGYDLYASEGVVIGARGRALVPTGIAVAVPAGTYGRIAPRSGLAVKHGIDIGAGVVDADYRGEVKVVTFNHGDEDYTVIVGSRIAQLIIERIETPEVHETDALCVTARNASGWGSTGT
jgi:deoxyuridine 5'-triphosphate nucleotidohydrolase